MCSNEKILPEENRIEMIPLKLQTQKEVKDKPDKDDQSNTLLENNTSRKNGKVLPQILCTLAAAVGHFCTGMINSWSGNAIPAITDDPDFEVDNWASSLIVGTISFGALLGCLGAGKLIDLTGRRFTLMMTSPVMCVGWLLIALAPNFYLIYIGRLITGFSTGFVLSSVQIYSSETCETRMRGRLGSLPPFCLTLGVLFGYIIAGGLHWRTSAYTAAGVSLLLLVTMFIAPKSPYWLLLKDRREEAKQVLQRIRGEDFDVSDELEEMEKKLTSVGRDVKYSELLKPRTRYPMAAALLMMLSQQTSGAQIIMMYTGTILRAANSSIDSSLGTILTGVSQVFGFFISVALVDKLERKTVIAISLSLVALAMTTIGVYFLSLEVFNTPWPGWIPTVILMFLVLVYCFGCRSIPWIVSSEVFNTSIRSRANSVCVFFNRSLNFMIVQIFPFFSASAGVYSVMFLHAGLAISCAIATVLFIPKTRGKSLEEIQEHFEGKALKSKNKDDIKS